MSSLKLSLFVKNLYDLVAGVISKFVKIHPRHNSISLRKFVFEIADCAVWCFLSDATKRNFVYTRRISHRTLKT